MLRFELTFLFAPSANLINWSFPTFSIYVSSGVAGASGTWTLLGGRAGVGSVDADNTEPQIRFAEKLVKLYFAPPQIELFLHKCQLDVQPELNAALSR